MVMKTFLKRNWNSAALQQLPVNFLAEVFLPALTSPIHYKGFNPDTIDTITSSSSSSWRAKGTATATGNVPGSSSGSTSNDYEQGGVWNVVEYAAKFLGNFLLEADAASCREVITAGLTCLCGQEVSRVGLQAMLGCLAAAAPAAAGGKLADGCEEPGRRGKDGGGVAGNVTARLYSTLKPKSYML